MKALIKGINILLLIIVLTLFKADYSLAFDCNEFSIPVPRGFRTDSESIANFVSFYGDNVTVCIKTEANTDNEDASKYSETFINELISQNLGSLDAQAGKNASSTNHKITTFSDKEYPALYIVYEGSGETDSMLYMEEYIVTTDVNKYTIIISADSKEYTETEDINTMKAGFTATDNPPEDDSNSNYSTNDGVNNSSQPANDNQVLYIFLFASAIVLILAVVTIIILAKKSAQGNKKSHSVRNKKSRS